MKIAVTGASGHLGNNLCRVLHKKNHQVRALIYNYAGSLEGLNFVKIHGDILDLPSLKQFFTGVDIVFHLAAKISIDGDPDGSVMQVNVEGTKNVVEACLSCGVKRLIHMSSMHALEQEPLDVELDENRPFVGKNGYVYDCSKSQAEQEVLKGVARGLDAVILNPTSFLGPSDYRLSFAGKMLIDLYNQRVPALVAGGFDWVDVRDVVDSCISAITMGRKGERYILSGTWKTIPEIASLVYEITGKPPPKFIAPERVVKMGIPLAKAYSLLRKSPALYTEEALDFVCRSNKNINGTKAREELSHHARLLKETLTDAYACFKRRGIIK